MERLTLSTGTVSQEHEASTQAHFGVHFWVDHLFYLTAPSTLHKPPGAQASSSVLQCKRSPKVLHYLGDGLVHPKKNASPKVGDPTKTASEKGHGEAGPGGQDLPRFYRISTWEGGREPGLWQAPVGQSKEVVAVLVWKRMEDNQQDGGQRACRRHQTCPVVGFEQ